MSPASAATKKTSAPSLLRERGLETLRYLTTTEVHTYAFSVAANAILSFFPALVLLMTLTRKILHSRAMTEAITQLLRDFLPTGQDFIVRNLSSLVDARKGVQIASLLILLVTSTGIFLPLEVALNQVWGVKKNRSYLGNQLISLALAFAVVVLAMTSVALTAGNQALLAFALRSSEQNLLVRSSGFLVMKLFAIVASIGIFFVIYWILPNAKISPKAVLPSAIITGLLWEAAKYVYVFALPFLDFKEVYGPFALSVTLMFWAFLSGLLLLAGAHLSASAPETNTRSIS